MTGFFKVERFVIPDALEPMLPTMEKRGKDQEYSKLSIPLPVTDAQDAQDSRHRRRRPFIVFLSGAVLLYLLLKTAAHCQWTFPKGENTDRVHHRLTTKQREELFLSVPNPESALAASRAFATHPHLAGSSEDFEDAKAMLKLFQSSFLIPESPTEPIFPAGSPESRNATLLLTSRDTTKPSAWIDIYYPILNTPVNHSLQVLGSDGSAVWTANLEEDGDPLDGDAHKYKDHITAWHGLSHDGEVEGQLVYANYGTKEDYDDLISVGTNLTGKIVIARYGRLFRGLKVKRAEELGAAGVLIYTDPRDDGFVTVGNGFAPYPHGPARNPTSVQRGSVQYLSFYPGDPTTPGYPSYEDAERIKATSIPSIPSLPISWANAERLLEEIGDVYTIGENGKKLSGKASLSKVKLINHVDTKVTPIWNAMASIPGHIRDEVVIIGCHRDAWVLGAADPTSGTTVLHEIIKAFGALVQKGWKPLRTVMFASWDGEEYGLIGSTEWGEDFTEWISKHAVAYLNLDTSVSGSKYNIKGSPSLAHLIQQAALEIPHPTAEGKTLWDAQQDEGPFKQSNTTIEPKFFAARAAAKVEKEGPFGVEPVGSGSDYTVFLQYIGVASSDQGFGPTATDAVYHYHSIYDSQRWQEVYGDPDFHRHVAVAKHLGLMALRLVDSIIVPLNTTHYALELDGYLDKVKTAASPIGALPDFKELERAIRHVQDASNKLDKEKQMAQKEFKKIVKKILRPQYLVDLIQEIFGFELQHDALDEDGAQLWPEYLDDEAASAAHPKPDLPPKLLKKLIKAAKRVFAANQKIIRFERGFISRSGIKEREWYKHLGVAPGKWLGYGATTFPALTEAITIDRNVTSAQSEAARLSELLEQLAEQLEA